MRQTKILFLAAAVMLSAGAAPLPAGGPLPDFNSFQLMRKGSVAVSVAQAAAALKNYDVVVVGELHDHSGGHLAQMALLRALVTAHPALSMEQFERDVQPVVDDYLAGRIGEETLKSKGRAWDNYAEAYRPLVEYAKANHLPVIAANAPASLVRCVAREGEDVLGTLPADKRAEVAARLHVAHGPYYQKFMDFIGGGMGHGGDAAASERSWQAQALRDDTMAESIATYISAHPGAKVLHITGEFHAGERLGTIKRLEPLIPKLKIALVMPMTGDTFPKDADFAIRLKAEPEPYVSDDERREAESKITANVRAATSGGCQL